MYFITDQVLLILMPYHMLVLVKSLKKAVFILKCQPDLAVILLLLESVTSAI